MEKNLSILYILYVTWYLLIIFLEHTNIIFFYLLE